MIIVEIDKIEYIKSPFLNSLQSKSTADRRFTNDADRTAAESIGTHTSVVRKSDQ